MEQTHSGHASCTFAAVLLGAWERGDLKILKHEIESTLRMRPAGALSELEWERRELISGIAESMRETLTKHSGDMARCDVEMSLELLRHLAANGGN